MPKIEEVRATVAGALKERGIGYAAFWDDIREGRRDDGPFMVGALAWAERTHASAEKASAA